MGRKVTIEVTDDDISDGVQHNCHLCPVAIAIIHSGIAKYVTVHPHAVMMRNTLGMYGRLIRLPDKVINFIGTFDELGPTAVEPFSFEIEVPDVIE